MFYEKVVKFKPLSEIIPKWVMDYPEVIKTSPVFSLKEEYSTYTHLTERHIQAIWLEQKYFSNLTSRSKEPIKVLSPGIWNSEAGPDFLKAHLIIGDRELRGDVEIHLSDEGWHAHGHQTDSRYNNVIFHLSFWNSKRSLTLEKENGETFTQGYLESFLTIPKKRILNIINLELYPYRKFIGSGKCAETLFKNLSEEEITALLLSASNWRLQRKYEHLLSHTRPPLFPILTGIAIALGYKKNSEPFITILELLNDNLHLPEKKLITLGIGITGFFTAPFRKRWKRNPLYNALFHNWRELSYSIEEILPLNLDRVRPLNHPLRRIVYLAKLLKSGKAKTIESHIKTAWKERWKRLFFSKKEIRELKEIFISLLPTFHDPYWESHFIFEEEKKESIHTLLGEERKVEIVVNVFLPYLYNEIRNNSDRKELEALNRLYQSLRSTKSGKNRYLGHRFFGDHEKKKILESTQMEQGAFQIHKDFCIHHEASCEGCPFVERVKKQNLTLSLI